MVPPATSTVLIDAVRDEVLEVAGVELWRVLDGQRSERAVLARALLAHLARKHLDASWPEISASLNEHGHSGAREAEIRFRKQLHNPKVRVWGFMLGEILVAADYRVRRVIAAARSERHEDQVVGAVVRGKAHARPRDRRRARRAHAVL